ncbi:copper resistance CopC family protein [Subtercola endophyticus]|uniref:copper resistance CopC family protein n=1 Tax=Subtercola endophyticus TaxID=2895559 RepID=UPI001E471D5F|nr:copper resistance CopC family protein [Subtercola endophyticus]UFS57824.1 copper resistance protein CopC [Subtercola endophyticus]
MSRRRTKLLAAAFAAVVAAGLALVPVTSASAHDFLVDSTPALNSTVTTPLSTVSLTFNDLVLDLSGDGASSVVEVTGPDGASTHFETGCPTILGRTVSAPVALGAPGKYQVSWQIVSSDGHPVSNAIDFTYAPVAGTAASAGSASGPACGSGGSSTSVAALPAAGTADASGSGINAGLILGVAGGIVVLAIVGVVLILVLSRRSRVVGDAPGGDSGPDDSAEL